MSGASGPGRLKWTPRLPHTRPPTTIGWATVERTPISSRTYAAMGPSTAVQSSQRTGWLVCAILVAGSPACIGQFGENRRVFPGRGPGGDHDKGVVLQAGHPREIGAEERPHLSHDGVEQLVRRGGFGHERGHTPQRGLFGGQRAQLGAACFDRPLRLGQLGVGAPAVGHVPADAVCDASLRHGPCVPLKPAHRAVGADDPVLESDHVVPSRET